MSLIDSNMKIYLARAFAIAHHGDQVDKCGMPYVGHLERVATFVEGWLSPGFSTEVVVAAWLHDVVEDTDTTVGDVEAAFGMRVGELVDLLTRRPHPEETHAEYIERVCADPDAVIIKIADVLDNMDPNRRNSEGNRPDEYDGMLTRYHKALARLVREL